MLSEVITYASPSPQQPNSRGNYTTIDLERITSAPAGAPGPIEVHRSIRYHVTSVPTSGVELQQRTIDSYQSSTVSMGSQTIEMFAGSTTTDGIDQTANRVKGNGPYHYHSVEATQYAAPLVLLVFPLVKGTTQEPLARTLTTLIHSANAGGTVYTDRNTTTQFMDSGGYVETGTIAPGETTKTNAYSNGTARVVNTGTNPLREKIGQPTPGPSGMYQIPVTQTSGSVTHTFLAEDWYPGNAAPPSPLSSTIQTVVGASELPGSCHVKVPAPGVQEIDSSSNELNVVAGYYSVTQSKNFLSNGTTVCRQTSRTTKNYKVETGSLTRTTVDNSTEALVSKSIP
jgi:hypothetical protein